MPSLIAVSAKIRGLALRTASEMFSSGAGDVHRAGSKASDPEFPIAPVHLPGPVAPGSKSCEWQEYLIEAWALGCFMISIGVVVMLLEAPPSAVHTLIPNAFLRRLIMAAVLGLTAVVLIYSPWGQRSGAHMNPAVTLAFLRLGKIAPRHAVGYIAAQTVGGIVAIYMVWLAFGATFSMPPVSFVTTVPSEGAVLAAFCAELAMSALLMLMLLVFMSERRLAPYTGIMVGLLIFVFISLEVPLSGMSINPARTLASAFPAHRWTSFWLYLMAPVLGMQLAVALFAWLAPSREASCAKLIHSSTQRCIHCGFEPAAKAD